MQGIIFGFFVLFALVLRTHTNSVIESHLRKIRAEENDPGTDGCTSNSQCPGSFRSCRQGSCVCKEGYVPDASDKCVKAPAVGEKCALDDGSILDCKGSGVDASCPADGPNKNKCFCSTGYEQAGKICKFKDQNLNEKCSTDADCGVAFSSCQEGKCSCIAGFNRKADEGVCVSEPKCPSGVPSKSGDGKVTKCDVKREPRHKDGQGGDAEIQTDSCPAGQFCFYHPLTRTSSGAFSGHCCPQSSQDSGASVCPLGEALKVDVCDSDVDPDGGAPSSSSSALSSCPWLTHTCVYAANSTASTAACCPSPCGGQSSAFSANGRCYPTLALGGACKFDVQCGRSGQCEKQTDGSLKCSCRSGFNENDGTCERSSTGN